MSAIATIRRDTCALIVGPRGSGKSLFAQQQLKATPHNIVIDTKGDFSFDDPAPRYNLTAYSIDELKRLLKWIAEQPRDTHFYGAPPIFRFPKNTTLPVMRAQCDEVARLCMARGNCRPYYDELSQAISHTRYEVEAPYFQSVVQQGRSFGVGALFSTQRPKRIPLIAGTESDTRITFFLRNPDDRKLVEDFMGEVPWKALAREPHSFVIATDETMQTDAELEPHRLILERPPTQRSA
jgi:hypothetical protein